MPPSLPPPRTKIPKPMAPICYQDKCATCHGEHREGKPPIFPAVTGVGQRLTTDQIQDRIRNGGGVMPASPASPTKTSMVLLHI